MAATADESGLRTLRFIDDAPATCDDRRASPVPGVCRRVDNPHLAATVAWLDRYFAGRYPGATPALAPRGSAFQQRAWAALFQIPLGQTRSYAQQAAAIGQPTATRAVARANGHNAIAIIIPCHRVIGADGAPTGYSGGVWRKIWLLEHERIMAGALLLQ